MLTLMRYKLPVLALILLVTAAAAEEAINLDVIHRIRQEATQNSKVMDHLFQLTDVSGSRLTNSPGYFKAADWATKQLKDWGLDARQESWGGFGRGWTYTRFSAHILQPTPTQVIGFPLAWSPGTKGKVSGEVIAATMQNNADLDRYKGRLKGKIVFMGAGRELPLNTNPVSVRYSDQELQQLAQAAPGRGGRGGNPPGTAAISAAGSGRGGGTGLTPPDGDNAADDGKDKDNDKDKAKDKGKGKGGGQQFTNRLNQFLADEGVLVAVRNGGTGSEGGTVFAQAAGSRQTDNPLPPPTVALSTEHYNRVLRLLDARIPVKMEFEVEAEILEPRDSVNVIAEIPGTTKRDEVVMIGAHLDSWHGGTGATDNAAGSAVMIEVMRILKELKVPMARTVRMGLWGGEEQGYLGSRAYVKDHFADRTNMSLKPEHAKLSGYFNVDNGSGKIRGVYLQGNDSMRPIFEAWLKPVSDLGATTISIRDTGGTDHQSFDEVGLPGFQFIQDWLDYNTRTHHSNMDVYDRVQRDDMQQMAAVVASFVYNAATRPDLLPRKPLPRPSGRGGNAKGKQN